MKEFFRFLQSPYDKPMVEGWRSKVRLTLRSLGVLFVLLLALAALQMLYAHFINSRSSEETRQAYQNGFAAIAQKAGTPLFLLYTCLIGPFLEEVAFRLPFSFKRSHILAGLPLLVLIISTTLGNGYLAIGIGAVMAGIALLACKSISQELMDSIKQKHGILLLHVTALLFALLHIGNYGELNIYHLASYFFAIGSILLSAYMLFYVRIRAGFGYGLALHVAVNSFMLYRYA